MKKLTELLKEFKSQAYFNGNMKIGQVYSNPYARSFVNEKGEEMQRESELNIEQKQAFLEAVKSYKRYSESIYRNRDLKEVYQSIKNVVEVAQKMTIDETQDWFDGVTVGRHMKRMNESFKVFEKTLKEVSTLQQRLESAYDEIGEVLGKYYEINELEEGNEFGAARAKAIASGEDSFEVDGKTYKVTGVDKEDKENAKKFVGESINEFVYPQSKMGPTFDLHFQRVIEKEFPRYVFYIQGRDVYLGDKKIVSIKSMMSINDVVAQIKKKLGVKESVNESTKLTDILKKKYKSVNESNELKKLEDAIKMFQDKIKKQGMVTNARDEEHLARLKKMYNKMGGKLESVNEAKLNESSDEALTDKEQEVVRKSLERATGVKVDSETTDTRYDTGTSDFLFAGGDEMMLYIGFGDDDGYYVSIDTYDDQIAFESTTDFKSALKAAVKMAKKHKKRLTTEYKSVNEAKDIFFDSATEAVNHARKMIEKRGFEIDEDDWQRQIALGGRYGRFRPGKEKSTEATIGLLKNGKPQRKALQISLYGMPSGKYELTYYVN